MNNKTSVPSFRYYNKSCKRFGQIIHKYMHFPLISKEIIVIFRKKVPWYFSKSPFDTPHPHLNTKKLPWVLFEIWVLHHPPPRVLLIICAIEKVLAPPPPRCLPNKTILRN